MESIESLSKNIETKLKLISFTQEQAEKSVGTNNVLAIRRQIKTLTTKVSEIHEIKVKIQELKLENGDNIEDIQTWNTDLENKLFTVEAQIADMDMSLKRINQKAVKAEKFKEEEMAAQSRQRKFEDELKLEKAKLEQRIKYEKRLEENRSASNPDGTKATKLPKLVISKFNGNYTDWTRFWEQYEASIGGTDISSVTKFSYLKELLEPKVRALVDGLPLTTEGFERARNILKTKYGKESKIVNAYVNNIMSLEPVHGTNPTKVSIFYERLLTNVQALETLGRVGEVNGYVRMTLDKLEGIRGDLVRTDDDWQSWKFPQLIEALRKWTERNPPRNEDRNERKPRDPRNRSFHSRDKGVQPRPCVYCNSTQHKSVKCDKVTTKAERKKILSSKKLCFNCTGTSHRASEFRCPSSCQICRKKHHTSICEEKTEQMLVANNGDSSVIYPVVVVRVNGIHCCALLDTGAGSSYASAALLERIKTRPIRKEVSQIEMMMKTTRQEIEEHQVNVTSLSGEFTLRSEVTKVNCGVLLTVDNLNHPELIKRYDHLNGVNMNDTDTKRELPVHLILGITEYTKIKTKIKNLNLENPKNPLQS
ncbi:uncharacterized protein LOC114538094 [Dendronephthya gigantea]|uniref:uncharacterized protein LOC114538094 n=1 Tax=Dendronephthya gigantea TaxID=151771 RepID=UPI00106CA1BC|nr:uncharacterized protein LOC114538094 [Dendronephthya gigantea]